MEANRIEWHSIRLLVILVACNAIIMITNSFHVRSLRRWPLKEVYEERKKHIFCIDFLIGRATYNIFLIKSCVLQKYQIPVTKLRDIDSLYSPFSRLDEWSSCASHSFCFSSRKMDVTQLKCENLAKSIRFETIWTQYLLVIGALSPLLLCLALLDTVKIKC